MAASNDLKHLCTSWWEKLANATRDEHYRFAEKYLAILGWDDPAPVAIPCSGLHTIVVSYLLAEKNRVVAHFVMPGTLVSAASVVERGLDFCDTTRGLVTGSRAAGMRFAFITDMFRSYLYDARNDELLLYADTPDDYLSEFGAMLSRESVEQGVLEDLRRQPRSYVARRLREWCQRWSDTLATDWRAPEFAANLAVDRLLVLRFMDEHQVFGKQRNPFHEYMEELLPSPAASNMPGSGRRLTRLFAGLHKSLKWPLFAPAPPLEAILEQDEVAAPMLREFALLSRNRFQVDTILESFNHGADASEKARVRMIPENVPERTLFLAKQTIETIDDARIELDIMDEGYRAVLHWYDELLALYARLEKEFESRQFAEKKSQENIDLFQWSAIDANRPKALSDRFEYAAEHGMIVYYSTERQHRTARLLLNLHILLRIRESKTRVARVPDVECCMKPRPGVLESDRRFIYGDRQQQSTDEYGVM